MDGQLQDGHGWWTTESKQLLLNCAVRHSSQTCHLYHSTQLGTLYSLNIRSSIQSVLDQSYPHFEIIVVDNASTDGSVDFLKQKHHSISLIEFSENYGFTGGYNRALEEIKEKYSILLNSDIEVTPNWIAPISIQSVTLIITLTLLFRSPYTIQHGPE